MPRIYAVLDITLCLALIICLMFVFSFSFQGTTAKRVPVNEDHQTTKRPAPVPVPTVTPHFRSLGITPPTGITPVRLTSGQYAICVALGLTTQRDYLQVCRDLGVRPWDIIPSEMVEYLERHGTVSAHHSGHSTQLIKAIDRGHIVIIGLSAPGAPGHWGALTGYTLDRSGSLHSWELIDSFRARQQPDNIAYLDADELDLRWGGFGPLTIPPSGGKYFIEFTPHQTAHVSSPSKQ